MNSLTKSNLRGTFYTADGVHVPYKDSGGDIARLLRAFASKEPLKAMGKIKFGMDGIPVFIEIEDIDLLQQRFREGIP